MTAVLLHRVQLVGLDIKQENCAEPIRTLLPDTTKAQDFKLPLCYFTQRYG